MKASRPGRSPLLSQTRWLAYVAAAGATAVASADTAQAEIHYSGYVHDVFDGSSRVHRDFRLSQGALLSFSQFATSSHLYDIPYFNIKGAAVSNMRRGGSYFVSRLGPRDPIAGGPFADGLIRCVLATAYGGGYFGEGGLGYIGFKFNGGAGVQYGWVRVKVSGAPRNRFIVLDYAWGDPGDEIVAGQRRSAASSKPAPDEGALGLLALGGAGLVAWRRKARAA